LRVAFLSPCFWPEVRRGSERFVRELADGLIARGHAPRLITSHAARTSRAVEDGLPVVRHWRPPAGRLRLREFEDHLTHVPFSYLELRAGTDDVAHAVFATDACAAARWSARTGRPSVFTYMGIPDRKNLVERRLRLEATLKAVRGCSAVVALSRHAADAFRRDLGVEARVIHPGVDLKAFAPGPRAPEPTVFCAADAAEPRKRVDLLVRAFRRVCRERPAARLLVSRPRDPAAAQRLADGGVELVDVDDRAALADAYRAAWVAALPSRGEAFGLVLVEALACGTPVVATARDGMREIVDRDGIGRLFDGGEEELARALVEALDLSSDPAAATACRARAEDFSSDRCTDQYEALYRELR
jgi:glycosyltransferase involved in cell wall biosynthesis